MASESITLEKRVYQRLCKAKTLYESDIKRKIAPSELIDRLVLAYLVYRKKRGSNESLLLERLAEDESL